MFCQSAIHEVTAPTALLGAGSQVSVAHPSASRALEGAVAAPPDAQSAGSVELPAQPAVAVASPAASAATRAAVLPVWAQPAALEAQPGVEVVVAATQSAAAATVAQRGAGARRAREEPLAQS